MMKHVTILKNVGNILFILPLCLVILTGVITVIGIVLYLHYSFYTDTNVHWVAKLILGSIETMFIGVIITDICERIETKDKFQYNDNVSSLSLPLKIVSALSLNYVRNNRKKASIAN